MVTAGKCSPTWVTQAREGGRKQPGSSEKMAEFPSLCKYLIVSYVGNACFIALKG